MPAVLYFITAAILLLVVDAHVTPLTRGVAIALLLLPLCFTGRALLTNRIYAPVEMPYLAQPLRDHAAQLGVGKPHNGTLSDIAFQMIPWREATRRAFANREWPLLNRFELCGDVLAGEAQPAVYSPFTLIALLLPAPISFTYTGSITFFLAAVGAFLFARELGCSVIASMFAAVGWMFCGPIAIQLLWPQGFAWSLLPLLMCATHRIAHSPDFRSTVFLTIVLCLEVLAGHPETALHVTSIAIVYGMIELARVEQRLRAMTAALIAGAFALALTAIYLLPFLDAVEQTHEYALRTLIYAKRPLRVPPGFVRDVFLGDPFPWIRTASSRLPEDIASGSVIVALALYSVLFVRARRTWFFVGLAVVSLFVGAKAWPFAQLFHALPLFDAALNERLATAAPFALAMLAAFAVDRLDPRRVWIAFASVLVIDGLVGLTMPVGDPKRLWADLIPLALLIPRAPLSLLFAFLLTQRVIADGSLVPANEQRIAYPRLALLEPLQKIGEPFRIAGRGSTLLANTATLYGLEDVRGHAPIMFAPIVETFPLWSSTGAGAFHSIDDLGRPFLSMLNVRFALQNIGDRIPNGWRNVTHELETRLIENERVLPRAFIPRSVRIGVPPHKAIEEMAVTTDFAERAWLYVDEPIHDRTNGGGTIETLTRSNGLLIDVVKDGAGFVVISEAAWRGWRAYVDEKRVNVVRANHAFLAVFVPGGRHMIRLQYMPQSFISGRAITAIAVVVVLVVIGMLMIRGIRRIGKLRAERPNVLRAFASRKGYSFVENPGKPADLVPLRPIEVTRNVEKVELPVAVRGRGFDTQFTLFDLFTEGVTEGAGGDKSFWSNYQTFITFKSSERIWPHFEFAAVVHLKPDSMMGKLMSTVINLTQTVMKDRGLTHVPIPEEPGFQLFVNDVAGGSRIRDALMKVFQSKAGWWVGAKDDSLTMLMTTSQSSNMSTFVPEGKLEQFVSEAIDIEKSLRALATRP